MSAIKIAFKPNKVFISKKLYVLVFLSTSYSKIIWKAFYCDPSRSLFPTLQATIISFDVLDMINLVYRSEDFSPDQTDMPDYFQIGINSVSLVPIGEKNSIFCNDGFQHLGHRNPR